MPDQIYVKDFMKIPPVFFPEGKDEPFKYCKICNKELIENNEVYVIEKAFKQDLTEKDRSLIFEFAYCMDCMEQIRTEFSAESKKKIDEYFKANTNLEKRQKGLIENKLLDVDIWLHNCIVKNKSIDEVEEYQIITLCHGKDMLFYHAPYMICGEAMDDIMNLLSNKTLDIINDFWIDHIDLPPELEEIFKTKKPILL